MTVAEKVAKGIQNALNIEVQVREITVHKNNGIVLRGLTIQKAGTTVAPTIYPDWEEDENEIVQKVVDIYVTNDMDKDLNINIIEGYMESLDAERIYENVIPAVVNGSNARDLDENGVYHEPYLDMEITYRFMMPSSMANNMGLGGFASILLTDHIIDRFDIDINIMKERAKDNIMKSKSVGSIGNYIEGADIPMYVATANGMNYGAGVITCEEILSEIHDMTGSDRIYILPSSVNELIAIPDIMGEEIVCLEHLKEMVYEVNRTQVKDEEVLSDSVYIHSRDGRMEVA